MIKKLFGYILAMCIIFRLASAAEHCSTTPKCTCVFDDGKAVNVEPNTEGNEALAGTVGALSSLLVTSSGLGLWYYCKKRKQDQSNIYGGPRSPFSDQKNGYDPSTPPPYSETPRKKPEAVSTMPRETTRPDTVSTNVYRTNSTWSSDVNSRLSSAQSHYHGTRSDWK